jgi:archaellum component FlaG (FlaF/FlaG flagellin family)
MYEGIKILNGGQEVNLTNLQKSVDGEHILYGVENLKVFIDGNASYNGNVEIMENNSDVKISLIDDNGNEVFVILKGLGDILLTNNPDIPVYEVF